MLSKDYLKKLISTNDTAEVIRILESISSNLDSDTQNFILLQSASFNKLKHDEENGILTDENRRINHNKINNALVELIDDLPNDIQVDVSLVNKKKATFRQFLFRNKGKIITGIWTCLGLLLAYTAVTPQTNLNVQIDAQLNRVHFKNSKSSILKLNNKYDYVTLSNFGDLQIPAAQFNIWNELENIEEIKIEQDFLTVQPIPENESSFVFNNIMLENVEIDADVEIILEVPKEVEENNNHLKLLFDKASTEGSLILEDSLSIECNNCKFNDLFPNQQDTSFQFVDGVFIAPKNQTLPIKFKNSNDLLSLDLEQENTDQYLINQETPLEIEKIQFILPNENGEILSSLTGGSFSFLDSKDQSYQTSPLDKGVFLGLKENDKLKLTLLKVKGNTMSLKLVGEVSIIKAGLDKNSLKIQNPSKLMYLYNTNANLIYLLLGLSIALTIGLLTFLKST